MPYLKGYSAAMSKEGTVVVVWDRFHSERAGGNVIVYRDNKVGMKRGFFDYIMFSLFVLFKCPWRVRSVVFFSPQIFFFCFYRFLYVDKIYVDIRDWHYLIKFIPGFFWRRVCKVFVSSGRFLEDTVVPPEKVVLSHNCWGLRCSRIPIDFSKGCKISYVGSVRDFDVNVQLISAVANEDGISLFFYGDGDDAERLRGYSEANAVSNVFFKGAYEGSEERLIYESSSMITSLVMGVGLNNQRLLTNRLYNSALNCRPILVFSGTYLAEVVERFGLGLVVDDLGGLRSNLESYFYDFNFDEFADRCEVFIRQVEVDMKLFYFHVDEI